MEIGIGCHGGADIDSDGRCINQLDLMNSRRLHGADVLRQGRTLSGSGQAGNETFQNQCGFTGTGDPGYYRQTAFGNGNLQGFYRVNGAGGKLDGSRVKQLRFLGVGAGNGSCTPEKWPDFGIQIGGNRVDSALGNDISAAGTGFRTHFNQPIRLIQNLSVVVHQNDGVSVGNQVFHHTVQPHNIGRVQTDGRFIQHIQHPGGAVSNCPGQLHSLPLSGG